MPCSVIKLTPHTAPAKKSRLSLSTKKRQPVEGRHDASYVAGASVPLVPWPSVEITPLRGPADAPDRTVVNARRQLNFSSPEPPLVREKTTTLPVGDTGTKMRSV